MTTKTMMMALAMAMGLAASASVVEVKFTVKTDMNGKVTTKTYKGVYDTKEGKHAFYDVKAKKTIDGSYFGLVNDATAGKKIGQNAELIWGDASNPENVLVAGAWGTGSSKSGQAAGMINGKPATGTWTAKVNTKKTYEELLKKYKITAQPTNKSTSVIDDKTAAVASALNDVAAAKAQAADDLAAAQKAGEDAVAAAETKAAKDLADAEAAAAQKLADAQAKAAADIAAAEAEGEAAVKAAQDKAAADLAAAEAEAAADLEAAKAAAAQELAEAQAKAEADAKAAKEASDKALADAEAGYKTALETAQAEADAKYTADTEALKAAQKAVQDTLNDLVAALAEFDTPEMHEMFNTFLTEKDAAAQKLYNDEVRLIGAVNEALDAYLTSLDEDALTDALKEAEEKRDAAKKTLEESTEKAEKLHYTNTMLKAVYAKGTTDGIDFLFTNEGEGLGALGRIPEAEELVEEAQDEYDKANTRGYDYAVGAKENYLNNSMIPGRDAAKTAMDDAQAAMDSAKEVLDNAQAAVDNFEEPSYANDKLKSLTEFQADPELNTEGLALDSDKLREAYDAYKAKVIGDAKQVVDDALAAAQSDYDAKKLTYDNAKARYDNLNERVETWTKDLAFLKTPEGKEAYLATYKKALDDAKAKLEAEKAEYAFWLAESFSDNEKEKLVDDEKAALVQQGKDQEALDAAEEAVTKAQAAITNKEANQAEKLTALENAAEPALTLKDGGVAFATDKIKELVAAYVEKKETRKQMAVETGWAIRDAIKIVEEEGASFAKDIVLENWCPEKPAETDDAEGDDDAGDAEGGETEGGADAGDAEGGETEGGADAGDDAEVVL